MSGDKSNVEKGSLTEEQQKGVKDINFNFNRAKTLLDRETNIKFLSFKGNNFFYMWETLNCHLLSLMQ